MLVGTPVWADVTPVVDFVHTRATAWPCYVRLHDNLFTSSSADAIMSRHLFRSPLGLVTPGSLFCSLPLIGCVFSILSAVVKVCISLRSWPIFAFLRSCTRVFSSFLGFEYKPHQPSRRRRRPPLVLSVACADAGCWYGPAEAAGTEWLRARYGAASLSRDVVTGRPAPLWGRALR